MRKAALIIGLVCLCTVVYAQKFYASAELDHVSVDTFYRIPITPVLAQHLQSSFANVRLFDSKNQQVPFILQEEQPEYTQETFTEYEVVEKKQDKGCCTTLIVRNNTETIIGNISLVIRNADVVKQATLSGSDDLKEWFAIREKFTLQSLSSAHGPVEIKPVHFPLSSYQYYKLFIHDSVSAPLNIIKAGYYDVRTSSGIHTPVASKSISTSDSTSEKKTYLSLSFSAPQLIDKIELVMSGSPYFSRPARILEKHRVKKGKRTTDYFSTVQSFTIDSAHPSVIALPSLRTKELIIEIENGDNPPLQVKSWQAFQLNRHLVAWLRKGESYTLKFSAENMSYPQYDLSRFSHILPDSIHAIGTATVRAIVQKPAVEKSPVIFSSKILIWIAIVVVIAALGFMSVRMVREASQKKGDS
jgi:hypothetical protein